MRGPQYYTDFQAFRGFAAVLVIAIHCVGAWHPLMSHDNFAMTLEDALMIPISGRAPVILFFVLSGFVLTSNLESFTRFNLPAVAEFYLNRFFRIVPTAILGIFVTFASFRAARILNSTIDAQNYMLDLASWIAQPIQRTTLDNLPASLMFLDNKVNPIYWTLQLEIVGSLALPLFYAVTLSASKNHRVFVAATQFLILCFLPLIPYRLGNLNLFVTHALLFCFPLGAMAFFIVNGSKLESRWNSTMTGKLALGILVFAHAVIGPTSSVGSFLGNSPIFVVYPGTDNNVALYIQHLVEALSATIFLIVLACSPIKGKFCKPATNFLGKISFSVYVIHFPVLVFSVALIGHYWLYELIAFPWIAPFLTFLLVLPLTLACGAMLNVLIERPGMDFGRRLAGYFSQPRLGKPSTFEK